MFYCLLILPELSENPRPKEVAAHRIRPQSFERAITAKDFFSDDYRGTTYAAKLLGLRSFYAG